MREGNDSNGLPRSDAPAERVPNYREIRSQRERRSSRATDRGPFAHADSTIPVRSEIQHTAFESRVDRAQIANRRTVIRSTATCHYTEYRETLLLEKKNLVVIRFTENFVYVRSLGTEREEKKKKKGRDTTDVTSVRWTVQCSVNSLCPGGKNYFFPKRTFILGRDADRGILERSIRVFTDSTGFRAPVFFAFLVLEAAKETA